MQQLTLKPHYKAVRTYYQEIKQHTQQLSLIHEGNVAPHFANLLRYCAGQMGWTLAEKHAIPRRGRRDLRADGVLLDAFKLRHGVWEAKDSDDDLAVEVKKKFADGYPQDNILFQAPDRVILVQDGRVVAAEDIGDPETLVDVLKRFFEYQPPAFEQWERAVAEFKEKVPELARSLLALIRDEKGRNKAFVQAFNDFTELVQQAINPNISERAMEEMLIQHLLTERIFRTVFNNSDFAQRNVIAREIEKVINALTSRHFSRHEFLRQLDRFYGALESTAATIDDYSEKQAFLNTVYEQFFQGFSVKVADTHGIVYTPQPIVDFMVRSVDDILKREFGRAEGLASEGVAILDPFVGTGNFILRVMRQMPKSKLPHKYRHELFCNEVMLLPYYIASMNIEHEYVELAGRYEPFEGISLVDTFELAEMDKVQPMLPMFVKENTQRVQRQRETPIFVIIGNPPYNARQVNANDNNRNREYPAVESQVRETYGKDSKASDTKDLRDPYIKAFRWATNRIADEGIVTLVTNGKFLDGIAFDGVRKHLEQDFDSIYLLNLGGSIRKNPRISGTTHNVFGIKLGVCITVLVRKKITRMHDRKAKIFYFAVDDMLRREERLALLDEFMGSSGVKWRQLEPDEDNNWLTFAMEDSFKDHVEIGSKEAKRSKQWDVKTIFKTFSLGVNTNRDAWAFNYSVSELSKNIRLSIESYNTEVIRWETRQDRNAKLHDFVLYDDTKIKWSSRLKEGLKRGETASFGVDKVRNALFRPFCRQHLFFDKLFTHRRGLLHYIFPTPQSELENRVICVPSVGGRAPFWCFSTSVIPHLTLTSTDGNQCFPFYTYDKDGRNRRENITDWALEQFRTVYGQSPTASPQSPISKWDIFHYIYALLHHPDYRETYAANLRRELPRIPFVRDFWAFVRAGERLAKIHVHYEEQPQYPLQHIEDPDLPLDYRVEKMRLSRDKSRLKYNDFLTLADIPPKVYEYKLGNRSALEWVIDQYQVKTDKRSGITNDPNRPEDETYILRLVKQVITVSLQTVAIVSNLPALEIIEPTPKEVSQP